MPEQTCSNCDTDLVYEINRREDTEILAIHITYKCWLCGHEDVWTFPHHRTPAYLSPPSFEWVSVGSIQKLFIKDKEVAWFIKLFRTDQLFGGIVNSKEQVVMPVPTARYSEIYWVLEQAVAKYLSGGKSVD